MFTNYHGLPPEKDQLKDYLYHLISERKLSDSTIRQARILRTSASSVVNRKFLQIQHFYRINNEMYYAIPGEPLA